MQQSGNHSALNYSAPIPSTAFVYLVYFVVTNQLRRYFSTNFYETKKRNLIKSIRLRSKRHETGNRSISRSLPAFP